MVGEKLSSGGERYNEEANPWAELEEYGREHEIETAAARRLNSTPGVARGATFTEMALQEAMSRHKAKEESFKDKYHEAIKAAKKGLISGGILPAYLSVQALGLISGGGAEQIVQQGAQIIRTVEDAADRFVKKFSGENPRESQLGYGENLFDFSDDSLDFSEFSDEIFYGEDGHVVPTEMIYGKVLDFDGTMEERATQILDEMSAGEKEEFIKKRYAGLVAELDVIGDEIKSEDLSTEQIAKSLTGYLIGHCRYAGEVDDPRGRWGNNAEGQSNWEAALLEECGKSESGLETSDFANDFIIGARTKLEEEFGINARLVDEAYNALVGGEANCLGMASAVAIGTNYLSSLNNPQTDGPVSFISSFNMEGGGHAAVLYQGDNNKWKSIDPTFEVCLTKTTAEVLYAAGTTDLDSLGELVYRQDDFKEPESLSRYCEENNAECRYVYTGKSMDWKGELDEVGPLYETSTEAAASGESE